MAGDINHVVLVGRLTRDAELKYTPSGSAVASMSVAINKRRKNGEQWVDEAHFFDVVLWGKSAEGLAPYLTKGKQIGVDGELRQNRWQQDGQNRSKVEIVANSLQLLGGTTTNSGANQSNDFHSRGTTPEDYSANNNGSYTQSYSAPSAPVSDSIPDDFDDEIPF